MKEILKSRLFFERNFRQNGPMGDGRNKLVKMSYSEIVERTRLAPFWKNCFDHWTQLLEKIKASSRVYTQTVSVRSTYLIDSRLVVIPRLVWHKHPYLAPPVNEEDDGACPEDEDEPDNDQLLNSEPVAVDPLLLTFQCLNLLVCDLRRDDSGVGRQGWSRRRGWEWGWGGCMVGYARQKEEMI